MMSLKIKIHFVIAYWNSISNKCENIWNQEQSGKERDLFNKCSFNKEIVIHQQFSKDLIYPYIKNIDRPDETCFHWFQ